MRETAKISAIAVCTFILLSAGTMSMQQTAGTEEKAEAFSTATGSGHPVKRGRVDPFAPLERRRDAPQAQWTPEDIMLAPRQLDSTQLSLDGIVWSPRQPLAVINKSLVGIDDLVSGWTVVEIQRDKVVVEQEGRKEILKMKVSLFDKKSGNGKPSE